MVKQALLKPCAKLVARKDVQSKHPSFKVVVTVRRNAWVAQVRKWNLVMCDPSRCSHKWRKRSCLFLCHTKGNEVKIPEKEVFAGEQEEVEAFALGFRLGQAMVKSKLRAWLEEQVQRRETPHWKGRDAACRYAFRSIKNWLEGPNEYGHI